jgi:hypothetical protein
MTTVQVERWLEVRAHLVRERHRLGVAAFARYGAPPLCGDVPLLTRPEWLPDALAGVRLTYAPGPAPEPDRTYSTLLTTVAGLPLRNLPTYRLTGADLRARTLTFGDGHYFDGLDTGEAAAHAYAAAELGLAPAPPRTDPTDLAARPATVAISALTLRRSGSAATMPLHRRDPAQVGHAGGMIQVVPVGVFQPIGPGSGAADFSLWRSLLREYAEELLGAPEEYGDGPFDYDGWPFGVRMTAARDAGRIRPYLLGLGVDPLTWATDLLAAVVFDADAYDELFADAVDRNDEGDVLPAIPFTAATVDRYAGREPTQAAGAAVLRLAWRHRDVLLSPARA